MQTLHFTVDSALLKELGEHLVGKPYIALAELVKNGYDADAFRVTIELDPDQDRIVVTDTGHGMDLEEFKRFWMRIGSTHKKEQRISRKLHRSMTGSKGIGRLAVQYLAAELTLFTTSEHDLKSQLMAHVKWEEAVRSGELTSATVEYEITTKPNGFEQGTRIVLSGLRQKWGVEEIEGLAREIWWLRPPFRNPLSVPGESKQAFDIEFSSHNERFESVFDRQVKAVLELWHARIIGKNDSGKVSLALQYAGEEPITLTHFVHDSDLKDGEWEIRIYQWQYKQRFGIKVQDARVYFKNFGGVHVYDGGFHLPFYGDPRNDWLRIELDHSHRLTLSALLPKEMQVDLGMQFLPTLTRIFGVVNVSTSQEPELKILITRDRLQENKALDDLRSMVRFGLDWYAMETKRRSLKYLKSVTEVEPVKFQKVEDVLVAHESEIPKEVYEDLRKGIEEATSSVEAETERTAKQVGLIGPLATAGISTLAYQHELRRQFQDIEEIVERIGNIKTENEELKKTLNELKEDLSLWVQRVKSTSAMFAYFADGENLRMRERFPARKVLEETKAQISVLARGIPIEVVNVDENLLLPKASLVEWAAIFQNVFTNAFNALVDSDKKLIKVSSKVNDRDREILIQDTGSGVNLKTAGTLFEPFERRITISPERRALGYGGMGLGLTIVRLVANNIGCRVAFVEPEEGFSTAFCLSWRESE